MQVDVQVSPDASAVEDLKPASAGGQDERSYPADLISPAGPFPHDLGVEEPGSFVDRPLASESVTER